MYNILILLQIHNNNAMTILTLENFRAQHKYMRDLI